MDITYRIAAIFVATTISLASSATPGAAIHPQTALPADTPASLELSNVIRVSAGAQHTCAVDGAGAVTCWGSNASGQLGDGSGANRNLPVPVSGLAGGATAVTTGDGHTCALLGGGSAACWGLNQSGQIGDGTTTTRTLPVGVAGLDSGVTAIAAGGAHTCAIVGGGVQCWGKNASGQLGDGTLDDHAAPVTVTGLITTAISVATGLGHTCAALSDGSVACWGANAIGQLGSTGVVSSSAPLSVPGVNQAVQVSAGVRHTCATLSTGGIKCWGANEYGQIGNGSTSSSAVPPSGVSGISSVASAVAAGQYHTCAIVTGAAMCWGGNVSGQLGRETRTLSEALAQNVTTLSSGTLAIDAGAFHTCAVAAGNVLKCWGDNQKGQLGNAGAPDGLSGLGSATTAIAAGELHSCSVTAGAAKCWGANNAGQLGNGLYADSPGPVTVIGLSSGVLAVAAGSQHTCALTTGGGVKCWGANTYGQLGNSTFDPSATPVNVTGLSSGVSAIAAGGYHTCAILNTGPVCWGYNIMGQLGNGGTSAANAPVNVSGLGAGSVTTIAGGYFHTCATTGSGTVKCWGYGGNGGLGDGTTTSQQKTPVDVSDIASGASEVTAGSVHTCALVSGGVKCWGDNSSYQVGDGTNQQRKTPVGVSGLGSGVARIAHIGSQANHTCVVMDAGAVKCWGANALGQLGDGTHSNQSAPVAALGMGTGVAALAGGQFHTCALLNSGVVNCWGGNTRGQVGAGVVGSSATPVNVGSVVIPETFMPALFRAQ